MARERKIVGIWPNGDGTMAPPVADGPGIDARDAGGDAVPITVVADDPPAPTPLETPVATSDGRLWDDNGALSEPALRPSFPWVATILALLGIAWLVWFAASVTANFSSPPAMASLPTTVATAAIPLVGLMLAWLLFDRGSVRSMQRHLRLLASLREEQHLLTDRLAMIDRHWQAAQATLSLRADQFAVVTLENGRCIEETAAAVEGRMREVAGAAALVTQQGENALRQMDGLSVALPKVDEVAQRAAENFRSAGQSAYQYGGQLEERIAALQAEASEAERAISTVEAAMTQRVAAMGEVAELAVATANGAADSFSRSLETQRDAALAMLADLAAAQESGTEQVEARMAEARHRLSAASEGQLAALTSGVTDAETRTTALAQAMERGVAQSQAATVTLSNLAADLGARMAAFETEAEARLATVARLFDTLQNGFDALSQSTDGGNARAEQLIARVGDYAAALEAATRQVDSAMPEALARLGEHVAASTASLAALPLLIDASSGNAGAVLGKLHEAEVVLERQALSMAAFDRSVADMLDAQAQAVDRLAETVVALDRDIRLLTSEAAPALAAGVEASEQTATAAAARARAAIGEAASGSAGDIERVIAEAIDGATGDAVANRIGAIGEAAERAVAAANAASDRLMRQLITIADSSAAIEARLGEVSASVAAHDRDTLARQMALTSEALQSTAVDMTRILSTEIADQAWDAYLKGDRGIFARRAVRLLTATEAKEVLRRYQDEDEFRGLVNRYIHDFEAMLRGVMDTRDGSALAVTLLSSDIGKVYVALAQAIERLRG